MADLGAQAAERNKHHPRYRLHLATWMALILVAGALGYGNARPYRALVGGGGTLRWQTRFWVYGFGWPTVFLRGHITESFVYSFPRSSLMSRTRKLTGRETSSNWKPTLLGVNILVGLVILGSTGVLVESRLRSRRKWRQLTLQNLFILTAVAALFFAFFCNKATFQSALRLGLCLDRVVPAIRADCPALEVKFPFWICIPLLFGIACTLYLTIWLSLCLAGRVLKRIALSGSTVVKGNTRR